ncbi:MAG: ABC transporter ATP-binding protein, partial [Lachnospiraceae bacterium]|nr:ABC transporter ATP-binding protein [Lachnospiraceae bacterium]
MPPGGRMGGPFGRAYMTEEEKAAQPKITKALLKRVFSYLTPYWKQLAVVLVCIAISSTMSLYPSVLTGKILDEGIIGRNMRLLVIYIVASFGLTLASNLIGVVEAYVNTWIAQHITYDMRNQMVSHLQRMSQRFFTSNNQGD